MIVREIPLHSRNTAVCRQDGSKKSGTEPSAKSAVQPVPGGFSARTMCLIRISDYCPGIWISAENAFYGHTIQFFLIRLYFTFCAGGFWTSSVLPPGETDGKPYFRNSRIASTPSLGKLRCSPVTRFFMFTVPDAISDSPVIERKGIERLSAYSNCFFSFAASG